MKLLLAILLVVIVIAVVLVGTKVASRKSEPEIISKSTLERIINVSDLSTFEAVYNGVAKVMNEKKPENVERKQQEAVKPRLKVDETKAAFTLQEAAVLLDLTYNEVRRLIQTGEIEAKKYGLRYLIPRDDIKWFLFQQKLEREN